MLKPPAPRKGPLSRRWQSLLVGILLGCLAALTNAADDAGAPEYRIKAAMVFKFLSYTEWPDSAFESADSPYRIWVLGSSPISEELEAMVRDRSVNERPVSLYEAASQEDLTRPHVVFVGRGAERYLPELAERLRHTPVLIVTESDEGLKAGSIINLRVLEGRIGFDVSLEHAGRSNLKLSSRLLSVASSVEREER